MRALTRYQGSEWGLASWGSILESVRTGVDFHERKYGKNFFDWLGGHPEKAKVFDEAMTGLSAFSAEPIAAAYDFSHVGTFVDIGGGHGSQLALLLMANPELKGILFDLEKVIDVAREKPQFKEISTERVEMISGSFFEFVPPGGDIYFMKSILHDWGEEPAAKILENCRKVIREKGKLLVAENLIREDNRPHISKSLDIGMLVLFGGRERTEEEYSKLFTKTGFRLTRTIPTASPYFLIEGEPV